MAAALELAAGPAAAPRDVVLAAKAIDARHRDPGFVDTDHHRAAKNIELGPQAESIESPGVQGATGGRAPALTSGGERTQQLEFSQTSTGPNTVRGVPGIGGATEWYARRSVW